MDETGGAPPEEGEPPAPVRPRRSPLDPTEFEREQHICSGHYPYRDWCRSCVAGRGRHDGHDRDGATPAIPIVAIDYCYLEGKVGEESAAPILAARDSASKATFAE
eukprot:2862004-Amphidinium_carterae.1